MKKYLETHYAGIGRRLNNSTGRHETAGLSIIATFRTAKQNDTEWTAKKVGAFIEERHGEPAELGKITPGAIAKEVLDFFPDCVKCQAAIFDLAGGQNEKAFVVLAKRGMFHAW